MLTAKINNPKQAIRNLKKEIKKLEKLELRVAKETNRNVARKQATKMVKRVSKSSGIKQKAIRGKKISGKSNQWARLKVWSAPRTGNKVNSMISFNPTPISFDKIGKIKKFDGGVGVGKYLQPDGFAGSIAPSGKYKRRTKNPRGGASDSTFSFDREGRGNRAYPVNKASVNIERYVESAVKKAAITSKRRVKIESERLKRKYSK